MPIANWSRNVPYLVSHWRLRDPLLEQSIVVYLGRPSAHDALLKRVRTPLNIGAFCCVDRCE